MAPSTNHSPHESPRFFAYQPQKQAVMTAEMTQKKIEVMISLMLLKNMIFSGCNNYFQG